MLIRRRHVTSDTKFDISDFTSRDVRDGTPRKRRHQRWFTAIALCTLQQLCSAHVCARDLSHKPLVQLLGQVLLCSLRQMLEWTICAQAERLESRRQPDGLCTERLTRWSVLKAIDHVPVSCLSIVALIVLRIGSLVDVALVSVGSPVTVQVPLEEGHGLHMKELIVNGRANNVGIANTHSAHVGGDLHAATRLDEGTEGTEEEAHQILVSPVHNGVTVKKTLDGP
mmetsp:Transcript_79134/g.249986  ORF Transcript_79134/g.249986 Transcript_79134/m.249986 type:complete len:226 (-) Transcript_79134:1093-1770(-)